MSPPFGEELPEVVVDIDEGFVDLDLRLVAHEERPDGGHFFQARGRHGDRVVGFSVEFDPEWSEQPLEGGGGTFYWGSGLVKSVGPESDEFVALLADLYQASLAPSPMRVETKVAVVGLANDPRLLAEQATHMKLFFENEDPARYAEVFLNVVVAESRVEFHEKDEEYRKPLVLALTESAG